MRTFDAVIPYLKKSYGRIAGGLVMLILVDIVQLITPWVMQQAIDRIQERTIDSRGLLLLALVIIGLAIAVMVLRYFWRVLIIGNSFMIEKNLRQDFYDHLMQLSQNFFNKRKVGDLMAYATNDLNSVRMMFGMGLIAAMDIVLMTIASFSFMGSIDLRLTALAVIPMPILTITISIFGKKMHKSFYRVQTSFATLTGTIQESISGIRIVKAFVQEKSELEKVDKVSWDFVKENINMAKIVGFFHPFQGFIISLSMIITLYFGGRATIRGDITIGQFIAFFQYLGMLVWPMVAIGWIVDMYQRGTASLKRLNEIFETESEIDDKEADFSIKALQGNIEIRDLTFRYAKNLPLIFDHISTSVEQGKTLAVVGPTGCGKTTLIELIVRIYEPPRGSILIDGHLVHRIPLQVLRRDIVLVPQDIFLFSDTIANNIRLGNPDAPIEAVYEAAKKAEIYDEIMEFEDKFETVIGERGVTLSGGQKQRVAIARALLTNPEVLILDDALSAVDTKTERYILENLVEDRKGKTNIIIAHRISSIQHADNIIVLSDAQIIEHGTHQELIAKGGLYSDLYEKQRIRARLEGEEL
ncbi:MAG TPA: ABC transporter ATP-binding protein [Candidatus Syntrophosphaera thermopropionivorans]|jgi:ATP-binding cassette subfamily B protein|nr:ABC transporter ATP-binding protein [Candidatus Syntrophosphaera sp.]HOJ41327.1 ABC transporter ATP-binding protein [Candidatus Syntrophosphaera thermopropionivorans]HOL33096.1 ABC transporter ATP-binding protein [Candidatus Syntrophosphaera thermopropionivorans]HON32029.1 ABC transporter ATP-binding protein [Candidatus Syntrophosphaera thermopropionivorans]HQF81383.1 ABC transporter ATP-binding protein [Candidatus Syntrophosphaera thermopropionivorans]